MIHRTVMLKKRADLEGGNGASPYDYNPLFFVKAVWAEKLQKKAEGSTGTGQT